MIAAKGAIYTRGVDAAVKAYERIAQNLSGNPVAQAMKSGMLYVTADAKRLAPVDTGRLRASISPAVETAGERTLGIVGSNVKYAPYQELGTRRMKAHPYLKPALDMNTERLVRLLGETVSRIVAQRY